MLFGIVSPRAVRDNNNSCHSKIADSDFPASSRYSNDIIPLEPNPSAIGRPVAVDLTLPDNQ
jgi:hypothetical protein